MGHIPPGREEARELSRTRDARESYMDCEIFSNSSAVTAL